MGYSWETDEQQPQPRRYSWEAEQPSATSPQGGALAQYGVTNEEAGRVLDMNPATRPAPVYAPRPMRDQPEMGRDISQGEALAASHADTMTLGAYPFVVGGLAAGVDAARGRNYGDSFRERVAQTYQYLRDARAQRPLSSGAGMLTGGIGLGGLVTRGAQALGLTRAPLVQAAAGRGPGAVLAQSALGAGGGAVGGGIYGGMATEGGANERMQGAAQGALWGGVTGGLLPPLLRGVGLSNNFATRGAAGAVLGAGGAAVLGQDPVAGAVVGAGAGVVGRPAALAAGRGIRDIATSFRNSPPGATAPPGGRLNMAIAPIGTGGGRGGAGGAPPAPPEPAVPETAVRSFDRALGRARGTVDDLEARVGDAVNDADMDRAAGRAPIDRRFADLNDEYSAEADTLANMPGQTHTRAKGVAQERAGAFPETIRSEMRGLLGVSRTASEALDEVAEMGDNANAAYSNLPEMPDAAHMGRMNSLMETPDMQRVLRQRYEQHQRVAALARARGEQPPKGYVGRNEDGSYFLADDIPTRELLNIKGVIDDDLEAAADRMSMTRAGRMDQGINDDYREAFLGIMDDAVPNYGATRAARGSAFDAREALRVNGEGIPTIGRTLLGMSPEEIARRMRTTVTRTGRRRETTDYERDLYRSAVVDEVLRRVDDYVSAAGDKTRNAGEVLDKVGLHNRLRAVFGGDRGPAVEQFLSRVIERAENLRRAGSWTGNSASARRISRAGDQFMATLANMGVRAGAGDPGGAAVDAGRAGFNALIGRHMERNNDAFGDLLLRDLADPSNRQYVRALMKRLRELEDARGRRAVEAAGEGALGGIGGGAAVDEGY